LVREGKSERNDYKNLAKQLDQTTNKYPKIMCVPATEVCREHEEMEVVTSMHV